MINFEWDSVKAESNIKKHKVSFIEAKSVFYDEFAIQFFDDDSSELEDRFLMLGMSNETPAVPASFHNPVLTGDTERLQKKFS